MADGETFAPSNQSTQEERLKYVPELDGIRAIAVVAVILFHSQPNIVFTGGFVGVDLFFVLSAYLISSKLAEGQTLLTFYRNRALRLYPALLFMLAAYVIVAPFLWTGPHLRDAALVAIYVSDFTYAAWQIPQYLQHTWSLAIEEQFYLIWPLILFALLKAKRPLVWLGVAYLAMIVWRAQFDWQQYYYRPDTHGTGLILGAMLFFAQPRAGKWFGYAGLALLVPVLLMGGFIRSQLYIPIAELAAALLIISPPSLLKSPALVHIGRLSYAMYLWHFPIAFWGRHNVGYLETISISLLGSYAMAVLSYHTVEAWGRQIKSRYGAKGGVPPATAVQADDMR